MKINLRSVFSLCLSASCIALFWCAVLPQVASAEAATLYGTAADCKEGVEAKGIFRYPTGVDEKTLGVIVDPEFNAKMKKERNTPDLSVTPIYDLIVEAVPTFASCYTDTPEKFSTEPPRTLPFPVSIKLGSETLVGPGAFSYEGRKSEGGRFLYDWKLPGWKKGIAPQEKLERLIEAVQKEDPTLRISVIIKRPDGTVASQEESRVTFGLCAQLSGGDPHAVISMRGKSAQSSLTAAGLVRLADSIRQDAFEQIQPFRKYSEPFLNKAEKSYFAHFVDLATPDDTKWKMLFGFFIGANSTPKKISSCGPNGSQYFFFSDRLNKKVYAPYGNKVAFMHASKLSGEGGHVEINGTMYIHEMSHSFAGLEDEYHTGVDITLYYANCARASLRPNPRTSPGDTLSKKVALASRDTDLTQFLQAYWGPYGNTIKGCSVDAQFRPSQHSIMNFGDKFNVPSCVWLLKAIKGQSLDTDWLECMIMDGIEKPTIIPGAISKSPLEKFLSWFAGPSSSAGGLFAAVAAPSVTTDTRTNIDPLRFISVETFADNGSISAEIFERVGEDKGEQTVWRKAETKKDSDEASSATGAETARRYCPNPATDFFKGSIYYENGKPWIEVKVDPDFVRDELRGKRNITGDIPLTPVYDLVVQIKPEFNYYCIPGWVEGKEVTAEQLPASVPVKASIVVGTNDEEVITPRFLLRTNQKDEQGRFIYEMKLKGWPGGITDTDKMEKLISAIAKNKSVDVRVEVTKRDGAISYEAEEKAPVPFSLCAPIWGDGKHKIVTMRGLQTNVAGLVPKVEEFRTQFEQTDPFKQNQYKTSFSFFADLKMHDDSHWRTVVLDENGNKRFVKGVGIAVTSVSSCPSDFHDTHIFFSRTIERAYALPSIGAAFVHPTDDGVVVLHEFGHVFAGLRDEYPYLGGDLYPTLKAPAFILKMINKIAGKNCSFNPASDFTYGAHLYGAINKLGCGFGSVGLGPVKKGLFRPSEVSIMSNHVKSQQFNVISCGYILEAIKGRDAKSYFPECAKMKGIITDGVTAQGVFERVFAFFESGGANLFAGVGTPR